jgi:hypothetical protein
MFPVEEQLHEMLDTLHTRDGFVQFVELLVESFNESGPPWENATIQSFLLALAHAARNLETYYDSPHEAVQNVAAPSWEAIAGLLFSARCARVPKQGIGDHIGQES